MGPFATILRDYENPDAANGTVDVAFSAGAWLASSFARRLVRAGSMGLITGNVKRDVVKAAAEEGLMEELAT